MNKKHPRTTVPPATLLGLLRGRALDSPNHLAYTFLPDEVGREVELTYAELDRQARAIAAWLQEWHAAGERALLLYPPGLDYIAAFFGCLYAGVIAVPAYPPRLNRPMPRIQAIVADAQARFALTTASILSNIERRFSHAADLEALHWLGTDLLPAGLETGWREPDVNEDTLAFLQYTSGSTSIPKGVKLTHRNLMSNLALIRHGFRIPDKGTGVFWLPIYHDMGLIGGVLEPLYVAGPSILMSPTSFLQRPARWLQAITHYRGTITGAPNFAYDLCVDKITDEQRQTLDLSSLELAFCGAEPIRHETLDRFAASFAPCGFRRETLYPCYGMAEATLLVSGGDGPAAPIVHSVQRTGLERHQVVDASPSETGALTLVSCGRSLPGQEIVIAHPETLTRCAPHEVGEIWVSGPSIAEGYWERPQETEQAFQARLMDSGEGPFLRTGDLGFLREGELFVTGRLKDLIIIYGRNHYPEDIERTVEQCHPALQPGGGAAFSVPGSDGEGEQLVITHEIERRHQRDLDSPQVIAAIRQAIAETHELQASAVTLVKTLSLPKTSSGKIQRYACRSLFLDGALEVVGEWRSTASSPRTKQAGAPAPKVPEVPPSREQGSARAADIEKWLMARIARTLNIEVKELDIRQPFAYYGMNSVQAVGLAGELEVWLGRSLAPTLAYDYPTIQTLARHLAGETEALETPLPAGMGSNGEAQPIAIVGMACRFPGAEDLNAFWRLLQDGVDAIREVPPERWDLRALYDPDPMIPGKMNTRWGGFLEHVDLFDPHFFKISPREAVRIDPQQRLLMELAWEALEDAGLVAQHLAGSPTSVFVGISSNDYGQLQLSDPTLNDPYAATGNALSIAANRLSYLFDLRGPSVAVDTACSSSLVAVHMSCQTLWRGEATLALAGGVNLILSPAITVNFTKAALMSPDGRCKAFDARANGYVRGEGAGVVVLKPLAQAEADGDPIYAVIRGSAVNHDGRTNGLMAPSGGAQEAVLREAYRRAGVSPGQVQYVEAHGTGTFLGDPIEARALGAVVGQDRARERPCLIGSVKTNIGHLEAAAGIAGLIKVALSLKHRALPASLHFQYANPHIPFGELPLRVNTEFAPWPQTDGPSLAGLSSFGFGGTNAHIVLEGPPVQTVHRPTLTLDKPSRPELLCLSAQSPSALQALALSYAEFLEGVQVTELHDICYTASVRRGHHDHRLSVAARTPAEVAGALHAFLRGENHPSLFSGRVSPSGRPKLAFVFSGQGPQWWAMGRQLLEGNSVFRKQVEECDQILHQYAPWSLLQELTADEAHSRLADTEIAQPALFVLQIALAAIWRTWGILPEAAVGHSVGEVAAAYVAGALSLEDSLRITLWRGRLMQRATGLGNMAAVGLSRKEAEEALAAFQGLLSVAAINGPATSVLSGDSAALDQVLAQLKSRGVFIRPLPVNYAFHSPQMQPFQTALSEALADVEPGRTSLTFISTVTGRASDGLELDASYWGRQLVEPVLFADAIFALIEAGCDTFLEISPHPVLAAAITECLEAGDRPGLVVSSLRRNHDDPTVMLGSLGAMYAWGHPIDWRRLYPNGGRTIRLPANPWQRERYWPDLGGTGIPFGWTKTSIRPSGAPPHPLLGRRLDLAQSSGEQIWETQLDRRLLPYLEDHRIQGVPLLPASVYLEMAIAAAGETFGPGAHTLADVQLQRALALPESGALTVQVVLSPGSDGETVFRIYSQPPDGADARPSWMLHAHGKIHRGPASN